MKRSFWIFDALEALFRKLSFLLLSMLYLSLAIALMQAAYDTGGKALVILCGSTMLALYCVFYWHRHQRKAAESNPPPASHLVAQSAPAYQPVTWVIDDEQPLYDAIPQAAPANRPGQMLAFPSRGRKRA